VLAAMCAEQRGRSDYTLLSFVIFVFDFIVSYYCYLFFGIISDFTVGFGGAANTSLVKHLQLEKMSEWFYIIVSVS
jgi:hypothetical protein